MTITMIVDECDQYEIQQITDTFSFNFSTANSRVRYKIVSGGGGRSLRESSLNQNVFFLTIFNIYFEKIIGGEGVCVQTPWSLLDPPLYSIHVIHCKKAIPHYTNSLSYIGSQQLVNNVQSMMREKEKKLCFGCVECSKHFFSFICQRPYHAVLYVNIVEE